jgi:glutamate/aspartate transport system substrate-binding protein
MTLPRLITALAGAGIFIAVGAQAQETGDTLKKIKETGTITLGVRDFTIPFSYLDGRQAYQGYSVDLCMKIVKAVEKKLGLATLAVQFDSVAPATRVPLMMNGTIDLECGNTTNSVERRQHVAFSPTIFVAANRFLSKRISNIKSLADMRGEFIVSSSGSLNLKQINALNKERGLGMKVAVVQDTAEGFMTVETGRAVAFAMDDVILAALAASAKSPAEWEISKEPLSVAPYGLLMRRGDPEFKKIVDDTIVGLFKSGEIHRIYRKWFQSPILSKGINLNLPMSKSLEAAIAKPTDSGESGMYAVGSEAQKNDGKAAR